LFFRGAQAVVEPWDTPHGVAGMHIYTLGHRVPRALAEELAALGLTYATLRPLLHLGRLAAGGRYSSGIHQVILADAMFIEGPSLVRLLDNLERAKLVERMPDPADGRCKLIKMTPAGVLIYARAAEVYDKVCRTLFDGIAPEDVATCNKVLAQLSHRLAERLS
jgi:MarR family transcriptional regulator for hemolysin